MNKFGNSPILYLKIQPQSSLSSGEEIFKCLLPYMGMGASLFSDVKPFEEIVNITSTEGPI